jgi:hypothetical protein
MTTDTQTYADPVADAVADHLRETHMTPLQWEQEFPAKPPPRPVMVLRINKDNSIHLSGYGTATLCVLAQCGDDIEVAKREAPAKILAEVENVAAALRAMLGR